MVARRRALVRVLRPVVQFALLSTCFGLFLALFSACTIVHLTRPAVKIGLVGPFEGQYRYVGYDAIYAVRLALREANAGDGVRGNSVELVAFDDQGTITRARAAARNLAADPQVIAVIGHFLEETTESTQALYAQAGLPILTAGTVRGEEGEGSRWLCPLLGYLKDDFQVEREDDRLSPPRVQWVAAGAAELEACVAGLGLPITVSPHVPPSSDVDVILLNSDPVSAGETVVALRRTGWDGVVIGGPTLGSPLFAQVAGSAASDVIFATPYRWPDLEDKDAGFGVAYLALDPHAPQPGPFALTAFQAAQALLEAIEMTDRQGESLTRQTIAKNLTWSPSAAVYLYRWAPSGVPQLLNEEKTARRN